jgi:hypothetical protein
MTMKRQRAKVEQAQRNLQYLRVGAAALRKYAERADAALQLAQDRKFGKRLSSGVEHGTEALRRARRGEGLRGVAWRLVADQAVHDELRNSRKDLRQAYARIDAKRRGRPAIRSLVKLASVTGLASLAAVPQVRERVSALIATASKSGEQLKDLAAANIPGGNGTRPGSLEDLTKGQLYARAQEAEIPGRSEMSKEELIDALRVKS